MQKKLWVAGLLVLVFALWSIPAQADTTCAGGVCWTFTSGGSDGPGVFDEIVTLDTTGAKASGTLTVFSLQFSGATNVTLESQTNTSGWSVVGNGNVNHCGSGNLPWWCVTGGSIGVTSGGPGNKYVFTFDVTAPSAPTDGDIQAFQPSTGSDAGPLAISNEVGIGPPTTVPEPVTFSLVGLGLLGLPFIRRRIA